MQLQEVISDFSIKVAYKRIALYLYYVSHLSGDRFVHYASKEKKEAIEKHINIVDSRNCFHLLSLPSTNNFGDYRPEFLELLIDITIYFNQIPLTSRYLFVIFNLLDPKLTHSPNGFQYSNKSQSLTLLQNSVESELLNCGKSVFVVKPKLSRQNMDT